MLDPLTIATSCLSLINGIASLTLHITAFVNDVRGARKDMDMISRELTSLSLCLGALSTDCQSQRVRYPETSQKGIEGALLNIDVLTHQVKNLLQNLSSGRLGRRIQWTMQSKDTVDKLRSSLETQKSTLEIALQCGSIQILCAIQRQVEKPAQDFTRIESTTQAIREDARVLRRETVDIKQLIRQEADALRIEILSLRDSKPLSADIQEFLRLSQEYSSSMTNPFMTPEQSDAGIDDSLTEAFSLSSLVSTPDSTPDPFISQEALEQGQHSSLECPVCGHQMFRTEVHAENHPIKPLSNTSAIREISRNIPPKVVRHVEASQVDSVINLTFKCGDNSFNFTFPRHATIPEIRASFYKCLQQQEERRAFWIPKITKPEDVRFKFNGSEIIGYPGERLSDLAQVYGFDSALTLESVFTPQLIPDFRNHIEVSGWPAAGGRIDPYSRAADHFFRIQNANDLRWHAPIAWRCIHDSMRKSHPTFLTGGVLLPKKAVRPSIKHTLRTSCEHGDRLVFEAVLMKPGANPEHWERLILMVPENDRWQVVFKCEDRDHARYLERQTLQTL